LNLILRFWQAHFAMGIHVQRKCFPAFSSNHFYAEFPIGSRNKLNNLGKYIIVLFAIREILKFGTFGTTLYAFLHATRTDGAPTCFFVFFAAGAIPFFVFSAVFTIQAAKGYQILRLNFIFHVDDF
jgi:hypothetical protein